MTQTPEMREADEMSDAARIASLPKLDAKYRSVGDPVTWGDLDDAERDRWRAVVAAVLSVALSAPSPVGPVTEVLIEPDALLERIRQAYLAGCCAVLTWTHSGMPQDDLDEASYDYVASLDFTEDTRPAGSGDA